MSAALQDIAGWLAGYLDTAGQFFTNLVYSIIFWEARIEKINVMKLTK